MSDASTDTVGAEPRAEIIKSGSTSRYGGSIRVRPTGEHTIAIDAPMVALFGHIAAFGCFAIALLFFVNAWMPHNTASGHGPFGALVVAVAFGVFGLLGLWIAKLGASKVVVDLSTGVVEVAGPRWSGAKTKSLFVRDIQLDRGDDVSPADGRRFKTWIVSVGCEHRIGTDDLPGPVRIDVLSTGSPRAARKAFESLRARTNLPELIGAEAESVLRPG